MDSYQVHRLCFLTVQGGNMPFTCFGLSSDKVFFCFGVVVQAHDACWAITQPDVTLHIRGCALDLFDLQLVVT